MRIEPIAAAAPRSSVVVVSGFLLLAGLSGLLPALGGPNLNGTLVVHDAGFAYTSDQNSYPSAAPTSDPPTVDSQLPAGLAADSTGWVWKVYAAFPNESSPRLKALALGEQFPTGVHVLAAGLPDPGWDFEIPQNGWPTASGGGAGISFGHTQTALMVECYWFGGYGEFGTAWAVAPHPFEANRYFVDDSVPPIEDPIAGYSTIGFGVDGTTVYPSPLPDVGACCYPDGHCELRREADCTAEWHGAGTDCEPSPCPVPIACCLPGGFCELIAPSVCAALGGIVYGGPCIPNPCPQPPLGACCFANGHCEFVHEADCSASWLGADVACDPNPCPQPPPPGACCFSSGVCSMQTQSNCAAMGGTYYGGTCSPNPCPQPPPTGACCLAGGTCVMLTPADCQNSGGSYHGGSCSPNPCDYNPCGGPPPPPYVEEGAELRQGGDTCGSATGIGSLPYYDTGITYGYVDDYDEVCPYTGSTSPDVVYRFMPTSHQAATLDLCSSSYDTKVYVYENAPGNLIACNDDAGCGYSGWQSRIENLMFCAGYTYYIVIDGYGGSNGEYVLAIESFAPCVVECPTGALLEGEPPCVDNYLDQYNGGCNSGGWVDIAPTHDGCAELCGRSCTYQYQGLSYRDTDWYSTVAIGGDVTYTLTAEFPCTSILIYGLNCDNLQYSLASGEACTPVTQTWPYAESQEVWLWAGASVFTGVPESSYLIEVCGIGCNPTPVEQMSWGRVKSRFLTPALAKPSGGSEMRTGAERPEVQPASPSGTRAPGPWSARPTPKPAHPVRR